MKKLMTLLTLLVLSFVQVNAQISVSASAGNLGPTAYTSLNAAFAAINAGTHQGAITISVTGNTVEPAPATALLASGGTSSYTSILIQPQGGDWNIQSAATPSAQRGIIELFGADNVTIDGDDPSQPGVRNLTFTTTQTAFVGATCIRLGSTSTSNGASNITIKNCNIVGGRLSASATTATYGITVGTNSTSNTIAAGFANNQVVIENNIFTRSFRGVYFNGSSSVPSTGLVIKNNIFGSATSAENVCQAIFVSNTAPSSGLNAGLIENNDIRAGDYSTTGFSNSVLGIEVGAGNHGLVISKNNIHDIVNQASSGQGAYGILVSGASTGLNIHNNYIRNVVSSKFTSVPNTNTQNYGIRIQNSATTNIKINYNTIALLQTNTTGSADTSEFSAAFLIASGSAVSQFINNIVINNNTSSNAYCFYTTGVGTIGSGSSVRNNNYVSAGNGKLGFYGAVAYADLSSWQTATSKDTNSISTAPAFVSSTNLHIDTTNPAASNINDKGIPVAGILDDYDGDVRGLILTDIGADEFTMNTCVSPLLSGSMNPAVSGKCLGSTETFTVSGATSGIGINYQWQVSSIGGGAGFVDVSGGIGANTLAYTTANLNVAGTYYYRLRIVCSIGADTTYSSEAQLTVNNNPTVVLNAGAFTYCYPGGTPVSLSASGADSYTWTPAQGLTATVGSSVTATPSITTTYTVTGLSASTGCSATATATINVLGTPFLQSLSASPTILCGGNTSTLSADVFAFSGIGAGGYQFSAGTGASLDPMTGASTIVNSGVDETNSSIQSLPFTFNFNNADFNTYVVSPNGWLLFGGPGVTQNNNVTLSNTNTPKLYPYWDDLATGSNGWVKSVTTGTAPNRIHKIEWRLTIPINLAGSSNSTFQVWLYETSNKVEYRYGTMANPGGLATASAGMTGSSTQFQSITFNTNTASNVTPNDNLNTVPNAGTIYTFSAPSSSLVYSWEPSSLLADPNNATTATTSLTASQTFTLTVSNAGCDITDTISIGYAAGIVCGTISSSNGNEICLGTSTQLTANASIGGTPYTYSWTPTTSLSNPNIVNPIATPTVNTIYTVVATDNCGTTCSATISINVKTIPTISATGSAAVYCSPNGTGVTLTANGGNSYSWLPITGLNNPASNSPVATPTSSTIYTVVGTDVNGCTSSAVVNVVVSNVPSISATATPATICLGTSSQLNLNMPVAVPYCIPTNISGCLHDYISNVTIAGINNSTTCNNTPGSPGYSYFSSISGNLIAGTTGNLYSVTTGIALPDDADGASAWIDFNQDGVFSANENIFNGYLGTIPATYSGTFSVPANAINGTTRLRVRSFFQANPGASSACSSVTYGETEDYPIVISGGFNTPSFVWTSNPTLSSTTVLNPVATPTTSTTYTATVTDGAGCTVSTTVSVAVNSNLPSLTATSTDPLCNGNNGTLTFSTTSGTAPYSYTVNGTSQTSPYSTPIGTYTVVVTDASTCSTQSVLTINEPAALILNASSSNALCNGGNGNITFSAVGGTGVITYTVNGVVQSSPYTANSGTYTIVATDANNCSASSVISVIQSSEILLSSSVTDALCNGGNGSLTFSATGGKVGPYAYVVNRTTNSVRVVNTNTNAVVADIPVGTYPTGITISPDGHRAYVTNVQSNSLSVINTITNTAIATVPTGTGPIGVVVSPSNDRVYVANYDAGTITVINAATNAVLNTITTSGGPQGLTINNDGSKVYIANFASNTVQVLNTNTMTISNTINFPANSKPYGIILNAAGTKLYTTNFNVNSVSEINTATNTITTTIPVGNRPIPITINSDGSKLYVGNSLDNTVSVINTSTNTVTNTIAVGSTPRGIDITPNGDKVFVTNIASNTVSVINTSSNAVVNTISGFNGPVSFGKFVSYAHGNDSTITYTVNGIATTSPYNVTAGTYTIVATDDVNCTKSTVVTVSQPALISITTGSTNPACNGGSGQITFSAIGGTGAITYQVNGVPQTSPYSALAGSYTIVATDANNCSTSTVVTLTEPSVLSVSGLAIDATCNGANGSLTFSATGGTGSISYTVNGISQTSPYAAGAGTYTVIATDANLCTSSTVLTITQPSAVVLSSNVTNALCNGGNGSLVFSASGGTGAITYTVNASSQTSPYSNIAGTYTIVATDANTCSTSTVSTISQPGSLVLSASANNVLCNGGNGSLIFSATGGSGTITYSVNGNAQSSPYSTGIGTYTVVATDANACSTSTVLTITQPASVVLTANATNALCNGVNGGLTFNATGGTGSISYTVNGVSATSPYATLAGTYTVVATDANACSTSTVLTITEPTSVVMTANSTNALCNGLNGSLTFSATGGTGAITYTVNGTSATSPYTTLAGTYTVVATDVNACTTSTVLTISEPAALVLTANATNALCNGANGSLTFSATGGTGAISYKVNGNTQTSPFTAAVGNYTIVATDANSCSTSTVLTVTQPNAISLSASSTNATCFGANGTLIFSATGGFGAISYQVNGNSATSPYTAIAGTYTIVATDANACSTQTVLTITQPVSAVNMNLLYSANPTCDLTGIAIVSATGGTGAIVYSIFPSAGVQVVSGTFSSLPAGSYTITATDINGCTSTLAVNMVLPPFPVITVNSVTPILCNGGTSTITVSGSSGTNPLQYSFNGGGYGASTVFAGNVAGNYNITVKDANGCTMLTSVNITQPAALTISSNTTNALCNGANGSITYSASGGTGTINYTVNGAPQNSPLNSTAGSYTVVATDANSCSISTVAVITQPSPVVLNASVINPVCFGNNGTVSFNATGGTGTITYTVNGSTQTSPYTAAAGSYTIVATDANSCSSVTVVSVIQPSLIVVNTSSTPISCNGGLSTLTASATGGNGILFYSLDGINFQSSGVFNNLASGTYTITCKDGVNCSVTTIATISQPTTVVLSANGIGALCNGTNGSLTFSASGGTGIYSYTVNGSTQSSPFAAPAGSYTIVATDANLCSTSTVATISQPTSVVVTGNATNALCNGANGSLTFAATGGTGTMTYTVNGNTATSPYAVVAGTYTVIATDVNACTSSIVLSVGQPSAVVLNGNVTNALCNGVNGSLTFNATGGTGAISYTVNGTSATSPFAGLAGTYTVVATDANACSTSTVLTITEPTSVVMTANATNALCNGVNGSLSFSATGGTGAINYTVNGVSATSPFAGLAGTYTVVATDANACITSSVLTITEPTSVVMTANATNALCNGVNGSLTFSATGGTGTINYTVNGVSATSPFAGLAGTYTVVATDANACSTSTVLTITEPTSVVMTANATNALCNGVNGSLTFSATGGTGTINYTVNGVSATSPFAGLAGTYTVVATDANACSTSTVLTITEPTSVVMTANATNALCNGVNGSLSFSATGGTGAISYTVNGTSATSPFAGLAGTYTIVATDANLCSSSTILTITEPTSVTLVATATDALCNGINGSLTFNATGGTGSITYTVNGISAISPYAALAGIYDVVASDANGCTSSTVLTINEPTSVVMTANATDALCNGINGSLTFNATGGTGLMTYTVNGASATSPYAGLAGTYTVVATDANACSTTTVLTISEPSSVVISGSSTDALCNGSNGSLTFGATGGTGSISYTVNGSPATSPYAALAGTYTIVATDANACSSNMILTINEPTPVVITANVSNALCNGINGSLTFSATGGTGTITYTVNGTSATSPFVGLAGTYTLVATDANACSTSSILTITEPTSVIATASTTDALCNGANGSLTFSATGGTGAMSYTVNGLSATSPYATVAGTYTIIASDANLCTSQTVATINEPSAIFLTATPSNALCNGASGTISFNAVGGTGTITYTVNGVSQTSPYTATPGTYNIVATDANGCTVSSVIIISQSSAISLSASVTDALCNGSNGSIVFSATGGNTGPYAYVVNRTSNNVSVINTNTNAIIATIPVGTYPSGITISPNGQTAYVTNDQSNSVSVINTATNTAVATIPVGVGPIGAVVSPNNSRLYVSNYTGGSISVIDATTNTVINTINSGGGPRGLAINNDGSRLYIANFSQNTVQVVNTATNTIVNTIPFPANTRPYGIVLNAIGSRLYSANFTANTVSEISTQTNTITNTIPVGNAPISLTIKADGTRLYVGNSTSNTVSVINTSTFTNIANISVGSNPRAIDISPNDTLVYVTNTTSNNVSVINTNTNAVINTIGGFLGPVSFGKFVTYLPGTGSAISYSVNGVSATSPFAAAAGTYTVVATDAVNCSNSTVVTVSEPSSLNFTTSTIAPLCNGTTGTINFGATGGTGIVSYTVNGTAQTSPMTTLAGTYTIVATDANSCTASTIVTLSEPSSISLTTAVTNALCNASNGTITFSAIGGTGLINYTVNGVSQVSPYNNLAGTYTIVATDANACTTSSVETITEPTQVVLTSSANDALCNGANGSLVFSATGGTGSINYTVNGTAQTSPIATLAGTYTIVATDANNCTTSTILTINEPSAITITANATDALCNAANGSLTFSASGGTGAITYSVNGTPANSPYAALAGTYTIVATDANACTSSTIITINEPTAVTVSGSSVAALCYGTTGSISYSASGGTAGYTYTVNGTSQNSPFVTLAGSYTVVATDANSCIGSTVITITEPAAPVQVLVSTSSNPTCVTSGFIGVTASGGTGAFTYSIDPIAGVQVPAGTFTGLSGGSYTITAVDANGCSATTSIVLAVPPIPSISVLSATPILCNGDGSTITVAGAGGTPSFEYNLNGGLYQSSNVFTGVLAGVYNISVRDSYGCTAVTTLNITQPDPVTVFGFATNALCNSANGSLTFSAIGGSNAFTYTVNGTSATSPYAVPAGTYTVVAIDANACTGSTVFTITEPTAVSVSIVTTPIPCIGGTSTITATGAGGNGIHFYSLDGINFQSSGVFANNPAGTYTVSCVDGYNCLATTLVVITQPAQVSVTANAPSILCNGDIVTLTATGNGGTGAFTYTLNGGTPQSNNTFNVGVGSYTIVASDVNNCSASTTLTLTEPTALAISGSATNALCNAVNGSLTFNATGGTGTINYTVNGNVASSPYAALAGTYTIVATDANACSISTVLTITEPSAVVMISNATNALCNGINGNLTFNATGGTGTITYTVNGTSATSPFAALAGTYTVVATDDNACSTSAVLTITEPTSVVMTANATDALCNGINGNLTFNATGGTGTISYTVNGTSASSPYATLAGSYTIVATDANACSTSTVLTITEPTPVVMTANATNALCNGINGSLTFNATGGTGTITYTVNGTSATSPYAGLAGTYTVVATDANACSTSTVLTITEPTTVVLTASSTNALCYSANGSLTFNAVGGTGTINYTVNGTSATSPYATGAGTYTIIASDANTCSASTILTITEPATAVSLSLVNSANPTCNLNGIAVVTASGGTGVISYGITPNTGIQIVPGTFSSLPAGVYTVTATDVNGCTSTITLSMVLPASPVISVDNVTAILCNGGTSTISVSGTGGLAPYQYSFNGGSFSSNATFSGVIAGVYNVTIMDANACTMLTSVTVNQPTQLTATASSNSISCNGGNSTIDVIAAGGTLPYSYSLNGGTSQPTSSFTGVTPGIYTIVVTDANACSTQTILVITQPNAVAVTATYGTLNCNGATTTLLANGTGGTGTLQYSLNGGLLQTSNVFNGVGVGTYTLTASDANSCSSSTVFTLTEPSAIILSASSTNALCNGSNGSITFSATGGTGSLTYVVNGTTQNSPFSTPAGTYTIVVTDANLCNASTVVTITQPNALNLVTSATNALCNGSNGELTFNATGGTTPITYTVNGIVQSSPFSTVAGNYTIVASDANNCSVSSVMVITQPSPIVLNTSAVSPICNGNSGSLSFNATGGTGAIVYTVNGALQTSPLSTLAGSYTVVATDNNNCSVSTVVVITEPSAIALVVNTTPIACINGTSTITASATGGNGLLFYSLDGVNFQSSGVYSNQTAGTYTITAKDGANCSVSTVITITQPTQVVLTASSTNALCNGSNGELTFAATGGTGTMSYTVNGTAQTSPYTTTAGTYTVVASDANACSTSTVLTITEPTALSLTASATNALCNAINGSLTFSATGGTGTINYTVNGTAQTSPYSTAAGTYTVVATDANACSTSTVLTITEPTQVVLTASSTNALCNSANGSLTFSATGGTGTMTYTVNGTAATSPYATLAGTYTVVASDANACSTSTVLTITEPSAIILTGNAINALCNGSNGELSFSATGGTGTISYTVNGTTQTSPLATVAGTYTVVATDGNACTASTVLTITEPTSVVLSASATNALCNAINGSLTFSATGGTGTINYTVNGTAQTSPFATGAGTYTVVASDANNCSTSTVLTITEPTAINLSANATNALCNGINGSLTFSATGGTGTIGYTVNGTAQTSPFATLAGTYTVVATDANACSVSTVLTITEPSALVLSATTTAALCNGLNGSLTFSATGGTGLVNYTVNGVAQTSPYSSAAGTYTVVATDANACSVSTVLTITQPAVLTMGTPNITAQGCYGASNGAFDITSNGGTLPYTYTTAPTSLTQASTGNFTNVTNGVTYTVTLTDANGCSASTSLLLGTPNPTVLASGPPPICEGTTGTVAALALPSAPTTTFVWQPGNISGSNPTVGPLTTTIYTVTGTDINGCTGTATITVDVLPAPIILTANPPAVCSGESAAIAALSIPTLPSTSFVWEPGSLSGASQNVTPTVTTVYTVMATDVNGCTSTTSITVAVNPLPIVGTSVTPAQTVCAGTSVTMSGTGALTYSWSGVSSITDNTAFTSAVADAGTYTVTGTDINGCTSTSTTTLTVYAQPNVTASIVPNTVCDGSIAVPSATGATSYVWSNGLVEGQPFIVTVGSNTYTVTGTDAFGCSASATASVTGNSGSGSIAVVTTTSSQNHGDALNANYYDPSCNLLAGIDDGAGGNILGVTTVNLNVDATIGLHNGQPYVRRWYEITPTSNGPANVVLYVSQADFDNYNSNLVSPYLPLPTGPTDLAGIANIRITKNDSPGLGTNPVVITPAVTWNGSFWVVSFTTPSFSQFHFHSVNPNNVPLPASITSFTGRKLATANELNWITSSEQNNSHFMLQYSTDGVQFTDLAKVDSKAPNGNSQSILTYSFEHATPALGHNYYRLKQVDIDGNNSVHPKIVDLQWGANGSTVTIYPNPTQGMINIDVYATRNQLTGVKVLDMSGRIIKQVLAQSEAGMNKLSIDLGDVAQGLYTIQVYANDQMIHVDRVRKTE